MISPRIFIPEHFLLGICNLTHTIEIFDKAKKRRDVPAAFALQQKNPLPFFKSRGFFIAYPY